MDSLLATYASSDDEEDQQSPQPQPTSTTKPSLSLPKPQFSSSSSSLLPSLPPPKPSIQSQIHLQQQDSSKPTSFFSSLPPPKQLSDNTTPDFSLLQPAAINPINPPKRVVQFRPPVPPLPSVFDDDDDEDDQKDRKKQVQIVQDTSVKSLLSIMPTPKNSSSLGALPSALGSGRRSIVETEGPVSKSSGNGVSSEVGFGSDVGHTQENLVGVDANYNYEVGVAGNNQGYGGYDVHGISNEYDIHEGYVHYDSSNWYNASSGELCSTSISDGIESFAGLGGGKRRRDQPPTEILEVKQDELMKNRPTEDKSKLTGIAFGPSYQPVSTKGKPTKLHKRKHQIGSLYFDMRQKEMELQERRAKGFLTKAETQAKYGW